MPSTTLYANVRQCSQCVLAWCSDHWMAVGLVGGAGSLNEQRAGAGAGAGAGSSGEKKRFKRSNGARLPAETPFSSSARLASGHDKFSMCPRRCAIGEVMISSCEKRRAAARSADSQVRPVDEHAHTSALEHQSTHSMLQKGLQESRTATDHGTSHAGESRSASGMERRGFPTGSTAERDP